MVNIVDLAPKMISTIFEYLEQTKDRQCLAKSHPVFKEAIAIYAVESKCYEKIQIESLPIEDWSFILSACGSTVLHIACYSAEIASAAVKLASEYCPNLKELIIPIRHEYWNEVKPLLVGLENLKGLILRNDYTPIDLTALVKLPGLITLLLFAFNPKDVLPVVNLLQLKNICIRNVDIVLNIYEFCRGMAQLESIELEKVHINFPATFTRDPLWSKLRYLKIGVVRVSSEMPYLPKLKILYIKCHSDIELGKILGRSVTRYSNTLLALRLYCTDKCSSHENNAKTIGQLKALKSLVFSNLNNTYLHFIKSDQLQKVIILSSNKITNSSILGLLRGCKNLRYLDVSGCRRANKNVVGPLINILKKNNVQPENPLVLTVHLKSFGDVNQGTGTSNPYYNLLVVKICENFIRERPFTVPDPLFETEYFVHE
ncbi:GL21697 [Drosophila persimilis]|uniref:GL21697 n=1 Tax=Drosophila persimilis TaxID=7234 RepID=B4GF30_DROPE|nr:GL21697 [Drosophila persimilis]